MLNIHTPPPILCTPILLPLRSAGVLDVRSDDERAIEFVNQTCDEDQIESTRHSADGCAGRRTAVELGFSGGERRQSHRPAAHVDDLSVQTMLLKNPRIFGDKKNPAPLVQPP